MAIKDFNYRIGSATNIIGRPPRFFRSNALAANGARFASVYAVREEDAAAIEEEAQTAAGFRGVVWSQRLWTDFDTYEAAAAAEVSLTKKGLDYVVYDTGGRGCHIGILRTASPSHTLPQQDKLWVQENLKNADLSIYWHLHLIRLPGAVHERTGRPKRLLKRVEGTVLQLPPLLHKAVEQRADQLDDLGAVQGRQSIFKDWRIVSMLGSTEVGDRHNHLVRLAKRLQEADTSKEEGAWVCREVNRGFSEPKSDEELLRIVEWAYAD